jgi:hypothetical protein
MQVLAFRTLQIIFMFGCYSLPSSDRRRENRRGREESLARNECNTSESRLFGLVDQEGKFTDFTNESKRNLGIDRAAAPDLANEENGGMARSLGSAG